ncbi:MAG: hypothetical protein P8Q26_06720 [Ascidiaceihabitans sp.]|nr:hypothetical protein [Ascidiaceihabitans sp.]
MRAFLTIPAVVFSLFLLLPNLVLAADADRFAGTYVGQAETVLDGETKGRDLRASIELTDDGFNLSWTSISYQADGDVKKSTYKVEFVPSQRDHIFGSAMKTNMFGKQTRLDPLKGEPFIWSRFEGDTFSVFSLFINEMGDYELQEYHRTLRDGGLDLLFRRVSNGVPQKEITAFMARQ